MSSSQNVPNGGLSLWLFVAISAFVPANPLAVTRGVEILNIIGILFLALFVWRCVGPHDREPWAWSLALVSVNPLSVLFSRKIWAQDLLPPFTMAMLLGWWYRSRWWGAALWGFIGALLGQIHLSGFFFAAAFVAVTVFYDRRGTQWRPWFLGSFLGALPLLPWIHAIVVHHPALGRSDLSNLNGLYFLMWCGLASGVYLPYTLGGNFVPFLASPDISGQHTYLAGAAFVVTAAVTCVILVRFYLRLRATPPQTKRLIFTPQSNTALALLAALPVYGCLLILTARPVHLFYLIIAFPLPALSLVWIHRASNADGTMVNSRRLLVAIVGAQALMTLLLQFYIHVTPTIAGDYGTPYRAQIRNDRAQVH